MLNSALADFHSFLEFYEDRWMIFYETAEIAVIMRNMHDNILARC